MSETRRYVLLGRMAAKSYWYGLIHDTSLKRIRSAYRRVVRKGWSKSNLKIVIDITIRKQVEVKP